MRLASRRAKSRISGATRSSNRITSAERSARKALSVSSSGSPGPAPTSVTWPAEACAASRRRLRASRVVAVAAPSARGPARPAPGRRTPPRSAAAPAAARSGRRARRATPWRRRPSARSPTGSSASMRERMAWPNTGAAPSVEMPTTSGERLTMAPNWKVQKAGPVDHVDGHAGTRTRASKMRAASASSSAAATTSGGAREGRGVHEARAQIDCSRPADRRQAPPSPRRDRGPAPRRWRPPPRAARPSRLPPRCRRRRRRAGRRA